MTVSAATASCVAGRYVLESLVGAGERYLRQVPTNAPLVALAKEWLGLDIAA
jgi:hypothetical protein